MNAVANSKQAKFIVDVSAESKHTRKSSVRFFSYDSKTAEIVIQAEKDNEIIPRGTISNVEIFFESVNSSYWPTDSLKWNDQMTINDDGLFLYTLTDDLLNYQGLVAFEVYINYINNDKSDSSNRIVYEQRTSAIDRAAGEIEIVYIKDMETAKKEVADKATEVKESLAGYDSGLDLYADQKKTEMDNFTRNVQETSLNEITKIQNELPKVKQVNVDETKKIKAEYPIVEQVAITEKEKIRAVLSTVDQTASEVSSYADRKISEYDAKFTQSNQNMSDLQQSQTALTTKLTETQQKIIDSDVFTKAESSVNVVYQLIGKEKVRMTFIADFSNKETGSDTNNPHWAGAVHGLNKLPSPLDFKTELVQSRYNSLKTLDGQKVTVSTVAGTSNQYPCLEHKWDIVEMIKRELSEDFFVDRGAIDKVSQVAVAKKIIVSPLESSVWGVGTCPSGNSLKIANYIYSSEWQIDQSVPNTTNTIQKITARNTAAPSIDDEGYLRTIIYTEPSNENIGSQINVDYGNLVFTIEISMNEHIKSMIATYCRPLEEQLNDLAHKVAAIESK